MKIINKMREKLSGLVEAISRYPISVIFLLAAAIVNAMAIQMDVDYTKVILTFMVGASLGFTLQAAWERFFEKTSYRVALMGIGLVLTLGYFLIVRQHTNTSLETWIRTSVALFALFIAYIWVPVIKSRVSFNESFMAAFKSFFNALLFSAVLFAGVTLIIGAIDLLLFKVPDKSYIHALNIIGIIFAPIYFLSLIPVYPGVSDKNRSPEWREQHQEKIKKTCACPKFLDILISYIIIPLLSVYTIILIIYIGTNITAEFWTDNRLEPMLVGFAIGVILVYILASTLENKFAVLFRKIFPKVLIPIVIFQIAASILKSQETGITYVRYYVIIFGIFAAITGVLLSFIPVRKNGIVAALLIGFSLFSILPPVDAFSISRINQEAMLRNVLVQNNMLQDNKVTPNSSITEVDKKVISDIVSYLAMMDYTKDIAYLGKDFNPYDDFYTTFGFYRYAEAPSGQQPMYLALNQQLPIYISGYDTFIVVNFYFEDNNSESQVSNIEKSGKTFTLAKDKTSNPATLRLSDENGQELISVNMKEVFDSFETSAEGNYQISKDAISPDQATVTRENDKALISLVAVNLNIDKSNSQQPYSGDFYVLIKIK